MPGICFTIYTVVSALCPPPLACSWLYPGSALPSSLSLCLCALYTRTYAVQRSHTRLVPELSRSSGMHTSSNKAPDGNICLRHPILMVHSVSLTISTYLTLDYDTGDIMFFYNPFMSILTLNIVGDSKNDSSRISSKTGRDCFSIDIYECTISYTTHKRSSAIQFCGFLYIRVRQRLVSRSIV